MKAVNIITELGKVVMANTVYYRTDFRYDIEAFTRAAKSPEGEERRFLWYSRESGTELAREEQVYIKDTDGYQRWIYHQHDEAPIKAFAVEVKGACGGRVYGLLEELDHFSHAARVREIALATSHVAVRFEDGYSTRFTWEEWREARNEDHLYFEHGQLQELKHYPESMGALRDLLEDERSLRRSEGFAREKANAEIDEDEQENEPKITRLSELDVLRLARIELARMINREIFRVADQPKGLIPSGRLETLCPQLGELSARMRFLERAGGV
jgi:hypothetical protein